MRKGKEFDQETHAARKERNSEFELRDSDFIRHSSFVIRHFVPWVNRPASLNISGSCPWTVPLLNASRIGMNSIITCLRRSSGSKGLDAWIAAFPSAIQGRCSVAWLQAVPFI